MENKICMVTELSNGLLEDIIKRVLVDNDIEVHQCLFKEVREDRHLVSKADLLVIDMNQKVSPVCQTLFDINDNLIVLEILNNGKSLGVYIDDISEKTLNSIINL